MYCEQTCPSPVKTSWPISACPRFSWAWCFRPLPGDTRFSSFRAAFSVTGWGSRRALSFIAVLWGILTLAMGLVPGTALASTTFILAALIGLRFLIGVAQAPLVPSFRWWNDRKMVPGVGVGIPERVDEHRADPGRRRYGSAGCLADGYVGVARVVSRDGAPWRFVIAGSLVVVRER